MYDRAAKTTNNRVSTSIVFMGITLLCKTRGHLTIGKSHPLSVQLYKHIITQTERMFNVFPYTTDNFVLVLSFCCFILDSYDQI